MQVVSDGMATNVSARGNQSDQRSEINEEEKLLGISYISNVFFSFIPSQ